MGSQGRILRVFEVASLPIPDIVASAGSALLLIEIDSNLPKAALSLRTYTANRPYLLSAIASAGPGDALTDMTLGFCRTGVTTRPSRFFAATRKRAPLIDMLVAFTAPRSPLISYG